ncbi:tagatose 1,6-diphosphate aldolase [Staphylococcus sp. SQ8-PEA]|uniref:Tagatose 1,6-diphosphate aldolase n=1 Tax=Staphylococcus marylandisciuri TaxID=2981529 RepID=A0ABT2QQT9_9STAP|nr:tagatose 1,6-diphosphate aldolase [Staphylococcus marylandisciuri]MCU5746315.1 tagatose 1,6-diphosphate aldolase [Staphylococcus marylandisciuri]
MTIKDLTPLLDDNGIFSAIAIDQRGALKRLLKDQVTDENISEFKGFVSEILTPHGSSILLDPEYGLPAAKKRDKHAGLILSYEQTGYDKSDSRRLPRLVLNQSVKRLKEVDADAVKILIYYDVDDEVETNEIKHAFVERVGSECEAENVPFLLEILTYNNQIGDEKGEAFAKVRPDKVNRAMKVFSDARYKVDVLKVETPVNMNYVEGLGTDNPVYTQEEAAAYFKAQDDSTHLPYIYLSGGMSADLFQQTLKFAKQAGSKFNGVLCGRATWKGATEAFVNDGSLSAREWIEQQGLSNLKALNEVNERYATPIK